MVPLRVQGTSFMYNQIRIMIGTAISVALGLIPIEAIPAFLAPPTRTRLPIAPAHTLILSGAGFHPFRKPHNQKHDFLFQGPIGTQRCTEYFEHVTLPEIKSSCELPEWDDWIEFVRETAPSLSEVQKLIELYTQWQNKRCMVAPLGTSI